jgi:hypothetical protein
MTVLRSSTPFAGTEGKSDEAGIFTVSTIEYGKGTGKTGLFRTPWERNSSIWPCSSAAENFSLIFFVST